MYTLDLLLGGILLLMLFLIFTQVVLRYIFNSPIIWVEEVTMLLLVWYGYIAIGILVKDNGHIAIEYFYSLANRTVQKYLDVFVNTLLLIFSVMMVKYGFDIAVNSIGEQLPASHLPKVVLNLPLLISGVIISLLTVNIFLKVLFNREGGET